ncbi:MAG: sulfate adenylyltransferase subunit CysN, partial [Burkholderiales bacterium]|nr:sulfate adenylyltransferase subunit CysN [Burkholderiales bacterium]
LVWMNEVPLTVGKEYGFKLSGKNVFGRVAQIAHRVDVNSMEHVEANELKLNEIGLCRIILNAPVVFDTYADCKGTGSFIIIDRLSNATAGAGMIEQAAAHSASDEQDELAKWRAFEVDLNTLVRKHFPEWGARDVREIFKG